MAIKVTGGTITLRLGEVVMSEAESGSDLLATVREAVGNACSEWQELIVDVNGDIDWETAQYLFQVSVSVDTSFTVLAESHDAADTWASENAPSLLLNAVENGTYDYGVGGGNPYSEDEGYDYDVDDGDAYNPLGELNATVAHLRTKTNEQEHEINRLRQVASEVDVLRDERDTLKARVELLVREQFGDVQPGPSTDDLTEAYAMDALRDVVDPATD